MTSIERLLSRITQTVLHLIALALPLAFVAAALLFLAAARDLLLAELSPRLDFVAKMGFQPTWIDFMDPIFAAAVSAGVLVILMVVATSTQD